MANVEGFLSNDPSDEFWQIRMENRKDNAMNSVFLSLSLSLSLFLSLFSLSWKCINSKLWKSQNWVLHLQQYKSAFKLHKCRKYYFVSFWMKIVQPFSIVHTLYSMLFTHTISIVIFFFFLFILQIHNLTANYSNASLSFSFHVKIFCYVFWMAFVPNALCIHTNNYYIKMCVCVEKWDNGPGSLVPKPHGLNVINYELQIKWTGRQLDPE